MPNSPDIQHKTQDPNDFLMGGSVPSASFLKVGASVTGTISEPPKLQQQRDMQTNAPKVWNDGSPMMQLVVTLQTDEHDREIEDDDGRRRIYVKFNMKNAVADAVRKAGAKALEVGGKLTVTYSSNGEPTSRGFSPPKFYQAVYVPPDANFLDDKRDDPDKAAGTNGHWNWAEAIARCGAANIPELALKNFLKSKGLSYYRAERDTPAVKELIASSTSPISDEVQFKDEDIPF